MLETGILLLFLVPGLACYAAIYGLFHNGKAIAPEPPAANSVQAVAIIAGASIAIHALTAGLFAINDAVCGTKCPIHVPAAWVDPYPAAFSAIGSNRIGTTGLAVALFGIALQSTLAFVATTMWLRARAGTNRLPAWIYGWSIDLANYLDDEDIGVVAYVLTTTDVSPKVVAYGGMLNDISLRSDGTVAHISLYLCERYLVDLSVELGSSSLSPPLSEFSFMTIDAGQIRNIAFEIVELPSEPLKSDVLVTGLQRLYR